jgi:hypothetical protein
MAKKLIFFVILVLSSMPTFAQSVDTAWVRRYNGPGSNDDKASAIAIDGYGNVFVTGGSAQNHNYPYNSDYATIKYDPTGNQLWVKRYNGPGNGEDDALAIGIDGSGNIYVTGASPGNGTGNDFATIKYYPNGDTAWLRRYNGPGNGNDAALAMVVDGSGNAYVTGYSWGSGTDYDFATIKYCPNGDTAWVRRYNGPKDSTDWAYAIAIDASGNVYVTGTSGGVGTSLDYATIKYDSSGNELWAERYNGSANNKDIPEAIAIDASNNVYVTGDSHNGSNYDYATIMYYPDGDTAWVRRCNEPGNSEDYASAIAVDGSGNVYLTGTSYLGMSQSADCITIKYDTNGVELWVKRYDGPWNSWDQANAIVIDNLNNLYVTGLSEDSSSFVDYVTMKYDQEGGLFWIKRYNGPGNWADQANDIVVDDSGNVYVTGYSLSFLGETYMDYATIKYVQLPFLFGDANGNKLVDLGDVVYLITYLYKEGPAPDPIRAGDANCNGVVDLGDLVYLINYLYKGGPAPCN